MTPQKMLDSAEIGKTIEKWNDIIPLGHPNYWELDNVLEVLARLNFCWQKVAKGWLKLDPEMIYYERLFSF